MAKEIEVIYESGVFKPLEKVDFPESAKMRIRIELVKPKGLLKLVEELEKKQKEESYTFEKTMTTEKLEEETEKLIRSFYNYLKQEKGLSEETASGHAHQISFFAFHYLIGYEGKSLLEVDSTDTDIEDYLGNWYIRKIWGSGGSDARSIFGAFKKFYKFLHERGNVEEEQLSDIISALLCPALPYNHNQPRSLHRYHAHSGLFSCTYTPFPADAYL